MSAHAPRLLKIYCHKGRRKAGGGGGRGRQIQKGKSKTKTAASLGIAKLIEDYGFPF